MEVVRFLKEHNPAIQIVWDQVLKASAGYDFHAVDTFHSVEAILAAVTLITPNYNELQQLQSYHQRGVGTGRERPGFALCY